MKVRVIDLAKEKPTAIGPMACVDNLEDIAKKIVRVGSPADITATAAALELLTPYMGKPLESLPIWHPFSTLRGVTPITYQSDCQISPLKNRLWMDHAVFFPAGFIAAPYQEKAFDEVVAHLENFKFDYSCLHELYGIECGRVPGFYFKETFPYFVRLCPLEEGVRSLVGEDGLFDDYFQLEYTAFQSDAMATYVKAVELSDRKFVWDVTGKTLLDGRPALGRIDATTIVTHIKTKILLADKEFYPEQKTLN